MLRLFVACALAVLSPAVSAQMGSTSPLSPTAYIADGRATAVHVLESPELTVYQDGHFVVVSKVVRNADGAKVEEVGRVQLPGQPRDLTSAGSLLYVATDDGLGVVDLAAPGTPELRAYVTIGASGYEMLAADGDVVYAAERRGGVDVYTTADPDRPARVGRVETPGGRTRVALDGSTLFVLDGYPSGDGLFSYDVTSPAAPVLLDAVEVQGTKWDILLDDDRFYVAGSGAVELYDVADPSALRLLGSAEAGATFGGLSRHEDGTIYGVRQLYDTEGSDLVEISLVQDDLVLDVRSRVPLTFLSRQTWDPETGVLLATASRSLLVLDPSEDDPIIGRAAVWGDHLLVCLDDGLMAAVNRTGDLRLVDVDDPRAPRIESRLDADEALRPVSLLLVDGFVYATHWVGLDGFLRVVDVRNTRAPIVTAELPIGRGGGRGLALLGTRLYVGAASGGILILDVSRPETPSQIGEWSLFQISVEALAVDATNGHVFALDARQNRVLRLDAQNPSAIEVVGELAVDGLADAIAVGGSVLVVASRNGLLFADISAPGTPSVIRRIDQTISPNGLAVGDGDAVVFGDGYQGLRRFDALGREGGLFVDGYAATDVAADGPLVALAAGGEGLYLFDLGTVTTDGEPRLAETTTPQVTPNPARGVATIAFDLAAPTDVEAAVYDLLGRRVATLASGARAAGPHEVAVETGGWAPGVYVVRLSAGDASATTRLTVVR